MKHRRTPGLESLNESRYKRKRQLVTGKIAPGGLPPKVFLWGMFVLVVGGFVYFWHAQAELDEQRRAILTKQRATAKLLGPKLIPMRDQIEEGVKTLLNDRKDTVDVSVDWDKLLSSPGLYMRARAEDATSPEGLRKAAQRSLRDGFSSCLMSDPSATLPTSGQACRESQDCNSGEFCNEYKICQRPTSPFNMRMLYRGLLVLSEDWINEVRDAGTEIKLTAYDRSLDSVTQVDLPIAIDVYQRAKYAMIVLDEDPKGGIPEAIPGAEETVPERVQRVAHDARIGVFRLPSGQMLARVTGSARGALRDVGTKKPLGGEASAAARARQANSCALALEFREKVMTAGKTEADDSPADDVPPEQGVQPAESGSAPARD
jgi:hypothetical protein